MTKHRKPFRKVVIGLSGLVAFVSLLLIWPVRVLLVQNEAMGLDSFLPSRSIPLVIGGLIVGSIALLYALSKVKMDDKLALIVITLATVVFFALTLFVAFKLLYEEKPDVFQPVGAKMGFKGQRTLLA